MRFTLTTVVSASLLAAAPLFAAEPTAKVVPSDWLPALSPSITSALQQLKGAETQSEMNLLSRQVADMTDAQLFIAYVRLYERLSGREQAKLRDEQTHWLKQRTKAARDATESKGGSLAALEANNAEVTFTEKRLTELRTRLKSIGSDDSTAARTLAVEEDAAPMKTKKSSARDEPAAKAAKKKKKAPADDE